MGVAGTSRRWHTINLGGDDLKLLNLEHPDIHNRVIAEIEAGVDVYYDRRWEATEQFGRLLYARSEIVAGKSVLILGAGVGLEAIVIGGFCEKLWINDLAPVSIELCSEQLEENDITGYGVLPGHYETLHLPDVDLIVGCFLVYDRKTRGAMSQLLRDTDTPILLVNEELDAFRSLMRTPPRKIDRIGINDGPTVVIFT